MTMTGLESKAPVQPLKHWVAILCTLLILPGYPGLLAQQAQPAAAPAQEAAAKAAAGTARLACGAHRALSGSDADPDTGCLYLPAGDYSAATVAGEEQGLEGPGSCGRGEEAGLGSEHYGHGVPSGCGEEHGGEHQVDVGPGQRISGATGRRNGCGSENAQEGARTPAL